MVGVGVGRVDKEEEEEERRERFDRVEREVEDGGDDNDPIRFGSLLFLKPFKHKHLLLNSSANALADNPPPPPPPIPTSFSNLLFGAFKSNLNANILA